MLSSHELNLAPGMSPPGMLDSDSDDSDSELLTSLTQHHSHFEQLEQRNGESPSMAMANNFKHDAMRHFHLGTGDTQSLRDRAASPVEEMMMAQGMGPSSFLKEELFQSESTLAHHFLTQSILRGTKSSTRQARDPLRLEPWTDGAPLSP